MRKNKKKISIFLILLFLMIIVVIILQNNFIIETASQIMVQQYENPINLETGEINNNYFNINSIGKQEENTTEGINNALKYCSRNNIKNIKFEKGEYLINDSINIPSNINVNLNSSNIVYKTNNKTGYALLKIINKENVVISNGKLIGDRDSHDYIGNSTHEWGMGIIIQGSHNVKIENLSIYYMTGDGIYISKGNNNSNNINIKNSLIYGNRRQGISIISGENVEICYNEIFNIDGTSPKSGIDMEANKSTEKIDNIYIHNNKFYNFGNLVAIMLYSQIYNVKISQNIIYGNINIYETRGKTEITDNELHEGNIRADMYQEGSSKTVNELEIINNNMSDYDILYNSNVKNIKIEGNENT